MTVAGSLRLLVLVGAGTRPTGGTTGATEGTSAHQHRPRRQFDIAAETFLHLDSLPAELALIYIVQIEV